MTKIELEIYREIAAFILYKKDVVVDFMRNNGYGNFPLNPSIQDVNDAVADNLDNPVFTTEFLTLIKSRQEYKNAIGIDDIAIAVSAIITGISNSITQAKMALFSRNRQTRLDQYDRETTEWYKNQARLKAKKETSIMIANLQGDLILKREMSEEGKEGRKTLYAFLLFSVAAIGLTIVAMKLRKK